MTVFATLRNFTNVICIGALLAWAVPTAANNTDTPHGDRQGTQSASAEQRGERLLAQAPSGWRQGFATKTAKLRIAEFFPDHNANNEWVEKVTFESLGGNLLPDPIEFVMGIGADQAATCERFEHLNISSGLENNYPTSVRLLTCIQHKITQKAQVTLIKAIQANDYFYVITRARIVPPVAQGASVISETEIATWAAYMRSITVCDSQRDEHPCP
ncbi:MAG: hypothetical protein O7B25_07250 [Gammaproteobacteria bacterium]|nr:hypothetical protein [Gammaproteobacteria bacterium]